MFFLKELIFPILLRKKLTWWQVISIPTTATLLVRPHSDFFSLPMERMSSTNWGYLRYLESWSYWNLLFLNKKRSPHDLFTKTYQTSASVYTTCWLFMSPEFCLKNGISGRVFLYPIQYLATHILLLFPLSDHTWNSVLIFKTSFFFAPFLPRL